MTKTMFYDQYLHKVDVELCWCGLYTKIGIKATMHKLRHLIEQWIESKMPCLHYLDQCTILADIETGPDQKHIALVKCECGHKEKRVISHDYWLHIKRRQEEDA